MTVSHVARYVSTTEKPTRIKNTSNVDRSTKDHTCCMYEVHNMIQSMSLPKGISFNKYAASINTNCQRKNAKTFPFYSARLRTATTHHINTKEHDEHVLYPLSG
jgi:hypothetical protein